MLFLVFTHVETDELYSHLLRQASRDLCLSHAGRPDKKQARQGFSLFQKPCPGKLDSVHHLLNRLILPEDPALHPLLQRGKPFRFIRLHRFQRHPAYLGQHITDHILADRLHCLGNCLPLDAGCLPIADNFLRLTGERMQLPISPRLVHQVDSLIRKETLIDMLRAH